MQDWQLLREFVEEGSQAAFGQLVERHLDFVYSTCRRELGDADLAQDAAQAVFLLLFQKAPTLRPGTVLTGWLFQTARFVAQNVRKQELRWQRRHMKAAEAMMQEAGVPSPHDENWAQIEPLLHEALGTLNTAERDAVLLRCFEGRSLKETGSALGVSEEAARKRVTRALEKLRGYFTRHGVTLSVLALGALLTQNAVQAAPAALSATAIVAAAHGSATAGTTAFSLCEAVRRAWLLSKIKIAASAVCGVSLIGAGVQQFYKNALPPAVPAVAAQPPQTRTRLTEAGRQNVVRLAAVRATPTATTKLLSKRETQPKAPPKKAAPAVPRIVQRERAVPVKKAVVLTRAAAPVVVFKPTPEATKAPELSTNEVSPQEPLVPAENIKPSEGKEEMQLKKTMVTALVGAAMAASAAHSAEGDKGTVNGILTAKGENWIEVRADGDKESKRYRPRWIGGLPKDGGGMEKSVLESLKKLAVPNRVKLDWVEAEGPRIASVEAVAPAEKSGVVTGEVTAKGENWVEVKGADGVVNRYMPRWVGGLPKDGGGLDKDIVRAIGEVTVGEKIRIEWSYDERLRVVALGRQR